MSADPFKLPGDTGDGSAEAETSPPPTADLAPPVLPAPEDAPPQPGVRRAALTGAAWIMVGQMAMYVIRLVSSMILTRLIHPEVYGLMDLAQVFVQGLHMFSDVGVGPAVVQSSRGDEPDFLDTVWTIQVIRGIGLWLGTALIAWPVAYFYEQPILLLLLPAVGFNAVIDGFSSTARFVLERRLHRGRLMATEVTMAVFNLVVIFCWVWAAHPDMVLEVLRGQRPDLPFDKALVWAVVAGSLGSTLLYLVVSHLLFVRGFRNHFRWDPTAVRDLMHFGKWVFFSTMVTFLAFQSDRLIVPKLMSFETSGIYGRAAGLAGIATGLMSAMATQLIFPTYARLQQVGRDVRTAYIPVHTAATSFGAMLVTGLLAAGPTAVHFMYGPAYQEAGWIVQFLAVGAWFQMLEGTAGASLLAIGQARSLLITNGARLVGFLIFVPLFWWLGGMLAPAPEPVAGAAPVYWEGSFVGILIGFVAADVVRYLVTVWLAHRESMSAWPYDIGLSVLIVGFALAARAVGGGIARSLLGSEPQTRWHALAEFACIGIVVVLPWMATVALGKYSGRFRVRNDPQ